MEEGLLDPLPRDVTVSQWRGLKAMMHLAKLSGGWAVTSPFVVPLSAAECADSPSTAR